MKFVVHCRLCLFVKLKEVDTLNILDQRLVFHDAGIFLVRQRAIDLCRFFINIPKSRFLTMLGSMHLLIHVGCLDQRGCREDAEKTDCAGQKQRAKDKT